MGDPTISFNAEALLAAFPPVRYGMAYGSGVFLQDSAIPSAQPMVDFVFAVDDPAAWHADNLRRNRAHYPYLAAAAGAGAIACVQESGFGARVWYNALVPVPPEALLRSSAAAAASASPAAPPPPPLPRLMKYGVISTRALLEDLTQWSTLYVAGRLHKPVLALLGGATGTLPLSAAPAPAAGAAAAAAAAAGAGASSPTLDAALRDALRSNLRSALCAALLLLPPSFTALQLFSAVTGLSYTGDWRMLFGEDPHKVRNIVRGNLAAFYDLYSPVLAEAPFAGMVSLGNGAVGAEFACDCSPSARVALGLGLPLAVQRRMAGSASASASAGSSEHFDSSGSGSGGSGSSGSSSAGASQRRSGSSASSARARQALEGLGSGRGSARSTASAARGAATYTSLREPALAALWERALARGGQNVLRERLHQALLGIVAPSARGQSLKGVLTAGPAKSVAYAAAKVAKSFRGFLRG